MESPESVKIKEEHDLDYCDNAVDVLKMDFVVNVKIENSIILGDDFVCVENNDLSREIDKQFAEFFDYECIICNENFIDSHLLFQHNLEHLTVILDKETVYICDLCSAGYLTKESLIHHIKVKHKTLKDLGKPITKSYHQCTICKKVYKYKSWHQHMRTVHATRCEKCPKCSKVFKSNRYLKRHIMCVHDGVKPNWRICPIVCECEECGKKFNFRHLLKIHKRNCHSIRSYQCYICKSILKCKSYLMTHIRRVHYFDGFEHTCSICNKSFKSPRYLKTHIKNVHSKSKNYPTVIVIED